MTTERGSTHTGNWTVGRGVLIIRTIGWETIARGGGCDTVGQGEITSRSGPCFPWSMWVGQMAVLNVHQVILTVPEGRLVIVHARGTDVRASRCSWILVAIWAQVAAWDKQSLLVERSWLPAG